jgi:uroporphyrinogen decarboxylase
MNGRKQVGKSEKQILNVLCGIRPAHRPVWLMRQAGRYLPEYRDLRAKAKNFLNMCLTPEMATEITLQPIRRFNMDAAILFADILLIPYALGVSLEFRESEGPVLEAIKDSTDMSKLKYDDQKLLAVYETLNCAKKELPAHTTLIGFCGAPWTVACYMIDGNSRANFTEAKKWVQQKPDELDRLINILIEASLIYLSRQIDAGAEVIQIFDSWAGLLHERDFRRFVIQPTQKLVAQLKAKYPHVPVIGFPREAGKGYVSYIRETGVDAMSLDQNMDLDFAKHALQSVRPLQGNLDPVLLVEGGDAMINGLRAIMDLLGPQHIVNLGHGVVPQTPPEHVAQMVEFVQQYAVVS